MSYCANCGKPSHGSMPCELSARLIWQNAPGTPKVGWTCPVCGTGCAPWLPTHCDQPRTEQKAAAEIDELKLARRLERELARARRLT